MNKKWNKISEKLPKINKEVCILEDSFKRFYRAKLKVYLSKDETILFTPKGVEEGELFWIVPNYKELGCLWGSIEDFPYWIECKDLVKIITNKDNKDDNKDNNNRFDLLDIREE